MITKPHKPHGGTWERAIPPFLIADDAAPACRPEQNPMFYPDSGSERAETRAKAICSRCPVRRECRDFALSTLQAFGIWGGTTPTDRARILRKRAREAA